MTREVRNCLEDEDSVEVVYDMGNQQIRRIPVMRRENQLAGILSVGDLALREDPVQAGEALKGIARLDGTHAYTGDAHA